MTLFVHNTASGHKEEFRPLKDGRVGIYVCGPTVYDHSHVGHARSYVAFDIIRRYLEHKGFVVTYVQNFTDVDDKIIARAAEKGVPPLVLSEQFIQEYYSDMDALNIKKATVHPKASETIPDMMDAIRTLISKGFAYVVNGSVYFEVDKAKDRFGKLRHQSLDEMLDGARVEVDPEKRGPKDFALWKAAKPGEISWDSPWGKGRPGWHIECSTMSSKYLGTTIDIHGGGMDLIFPHHESEILQAECSTGQTFARYWLHNGFVKINEEKMSKSLGNFFTIRDVLKRYDPMVLRFFLAYTHYRSPIDFSDQALDEAKAAYGRLEGLHRSLLDVSTEGPVDEGVMESASGIRKAFMEAMDDDFNTRVAITALFRLDELSRGLNNAGTLTPGNAGHLLGLMDELSGILGLEYREPSKSELPGGALAEGLLDLLIELRSQARKAKDFRTSDLIRDRLKAVGIGLEDGERTTWHLTGRSGDGE
jgi:cysteinyl-tRNA synthetase